MNIVKTMQHRPSPRAVLKLTTLFAAIQLLLGAACAHRPASHPCPGGTPRERIAGETVIRQRDDASRALFFVQSIIGAPVATIEVFWPERAANDDVFADYDVYVFALQQQAPAECRRSDVAISAIAGQFDSRIPAYSTAVVVTTDARDAMAIEDALSSLIPSKRERVKEVFLFSTPATDALLRKLPRGCGMALPDVREKSDLTICSTFDRHRFADVPVVSKICGQLVVAAMPPEIEAAPPCDDAMYPIFRAGLAGTVYERQHVLPRFGETR